MSSNRKRVQLSLDEKGDIIRKCLVERKKQCDVAKEYNVTPAAITNILKHKQNILKHQEGGYYNGKAKRMNPIKFKDIDAALFLWLQEMLVMNVPINGPILQEKAMDFARQFGNHEFRASQGWLTKFKQRHGVVCKHVCSEASYVNPELMGAWLMTTVPALLARFPSNDVYSVAEAGIFFQMLPNQTLTLKNEKCKDGQDSKSRITTVLCANMTGSDKRELLIIGKPNYFKNLDVNRLGATYRGNTKAWITSGLFNEWLQNFDHSMREAGRHVLLLLDNCSAHRVSFQPTNVEVRFLPSNTTAILNPMDKGIIQNMKIHYRSLLLRRYIAEVEANIATFKVTLLDAIRFLSRAWRMVEGNTVASSFRKAGFLAQNATGDNLVKDEPDDNFFNDILLDRLRPFSVVPGDVDFHLFATADDGVETEGGFADEEDVDAGESEAEVAMCSGEADGEELEHHLAALTAAEAYNCVGLLRGFLEKKATYYDSKVLDQIDDMIANSNVNS